jgi:CheY-like chemotaxis protein
MSTPTAQSGALQGWTPLHGEATSSAMVKKVHSTAAPSGRRVLIVDDHHDAAHSLGMWLRLSGHEVRIAGDGREGVAAVRTFNPHVAVFDIGMPLMNGYEAARAIRSEPWGRDIVLIALTGWDNDEDRKLALEAGFDHHMCKPVDCAALARVASAAMG